MKVKFTHNWKESEYQKLVDTVYGFGQMFVKQAAKAIVKTQTLDKETEVSSHKKEIELAKIQKEIELAKIQKEIEIAKMASSPVPHFQEDDGLVGLGSWEENYVEDETD